jgi:hypothetical protein
MIAKTIINVRRWKRRGMFLGRSVVLFLVATQ